MLAKRHWYLLVDVTAFFISLLIQEYLGPWKRK